VKIREFLGQNKSSVILVGLVILSVLFALGYIYMANRLEETENEIYDVSIPSSTDNNLSWESVDVDRLAVADENLEADVYGADLYTIDDVESILDRLGFMNLAPDISENGDIYTWDLGDRGVASYTPDVGDFMLESGGLSLPSINLGYISESNVIAYFESFMGEYLQVDAASFNVEVVNLDDGVKVTGTWLLGGCDVVSSINQESMIGAFFSENGDLESLFISLVRFEKQEESVTLVTIEELKEYLPWGAYPREEYVDVVSSSAPACEDYDCYFNYDIEDVSGVSLESAELVYYLNPSSPESVLPTYKLKGEGNVEDGEGRLVKVEVFVYANAVDPTRIRTWSD